MITKTRGIVFRFARLRETSIIVTIFTEVFGLQSYVVNGVRAAGKSKMALFQPLTLLDLVVYHREHANLNRIREVRCIHPYRSNDIRKVTIMMFIDELLNKTVREEAQAPEVFGFLFDSLVSLDELKSSVENFHLVFMIRLMPFLGFGIMSAESLDPMHVLPVKARARVDQLLQCSYEEAPALSRDERRELLDALVRYYKVHMDPLSEIKSIQVLRETLG
jgi:DNA repair protein RecO (recombination protein O)